MNITNVEEVNALFARARGDGAAYAQQHAHVVTSGEPCGNANELYNAAITTAAKSCFSDDDAVTEIYVDGFVYGALEAKYAYLDVCTK
jgi:hypothetical protein